ncbi:3-oxoacyl-[acyl-carrier-protein] reductase [Gammaproteobacteria bacterium]|nr:3-oxoacyl-[acyl-carrier-protein] reductase [Gammaproteobacteria bacterium]
MTDSNQPPKMVLVTGASRGIGRAIAQAFGQQGYRVLGTGTSENSLARIEADLKAYPAGGSAYLLKQQDPLMVQSMFEQLVQAEGGAPDVLIHNAGLCQDQLMMRMSPDAWRQVIDANLNGVFDLTRLALKPMIKRRSGRIIHISSVVGFSGNAGQANYSASKAGVVAMAKCLAAEVANRNITVNNIAPGFIETDMTGSMPDTYQQKILEQIPMKRMGSAQEVAACALFLASDAASYVTGSTIHVNGGMWMN